MIEGWKSKVGLVTVVGALLGGGWAVERRAAARADASVSPLPPTELSSLQIRAEGRLVPYPGAQVTVGTETGGTLRVLRATEKSTVKKGDLIAEIAADEQRLHSPRPTRAQVKPTSMSASRRANSIAHAACGRRALFP
jgi:multidrug efflux pump subunit AcrA (membrane-fusion protein)